MDQIDNAKNAEAMSMMMALVIFVIVTMRKINDSIL